MNIIYGIGKIKKEFKNAVLAIGVFDGVHRGHQALIKAAVRRAKEISGQPLVLTFAPHPLHILRPAIDLPYIVSVPYRIKLIERLGVAACIVVRFTKQFSRLSPEKFIKRYIVRAIHPKEIFVGDDFRFGQDRCGTLEYFRKAGQQYGFSVRALNAVKVGSKKIGSSIIRQMIKDGQLAKACRLLGRPVSVMGRVVRGDGRGRRLGFPTANLAITGGVVPTLGVYAVRVKIGRRAWDGMANIGRRPSFKKNDPISIETHLFDFHGNLYGQEIILEFVHKIREEVVFLSETQFIAQLYKDRLQAQEVLGPGGA